MPTAPRANLVLRQACFSLGPLQALLDPKLRVEHAGKLRQGRLGAPVDKELSCLNVPSSCFARNTMILFEVVEQYTFAVQTPTKEYPLPARTLHWS